MATVEVEAEETAAATKLQAIERGKLERAKVAQLKAQASADASSAQAASRAQSLRVAVVGATGGVGKHVVGKALDLGLEVVAIARSVDRISPLSHPSLTKRAFDFSDCEGGTEELAGFLEGAALVISCVGNRRSVSPPNGAENHLIIAKATKSLMMAMERARAPRLAIISSLGVGDSWMQLLRLGWVGVYFSAKFATAMREDRDDLECAETLALGGPSGLLGGGLPHERPEGVSVVVCRPAGLSNAPGDGKYQVALADGIVGPSISREDVASFLLTLTTDLQYDNGAVSVGANAPRKSSSSSLGSQHRHSTFALAKLDVYEA